MKHNILIWILIFEDDLEDDLKYDQLKLFLHISLLRPRRGPQPQSNQTLGPFGII